MNQPTVEQRERAAEVLEAYYKCQPGELLEDLIAQALADEAARQKEIDGLAEQEFLRRIYDVVECGQWPTFKHIVLGRASPIDTITPQDVDWAQAAIRRGGGDDVS